MAEGALFFIQSPILSPFSADGDVAGLPCYSLGLRYWNSDYAKPLRTPLAPASPHGDAMLHGSFSQLNTLTSRFAALEAVPVRGRCPSGWKGLYQYTESYS